MEHLKMLERRERGKIEEKCLKKWARNEKKKEIKRKASGVP